MRLNAAFLILSLVAKTQAEALRGTESRQLDGETETDEAPLDLQITHIVDLKNNCDQNQFQILVTSWGGTVSDFAYEAGFAVVHGLDTAGVASAEADNTCVQGIDEDDMLGGIEQMNLDAPGYVDQTGIGNPTFFPQGAQFFDWQWNMRTIGADTAWSAHLTGQGATVAVIDTGIDYTHVDLAGLVNLDKSVSFLPSEDQKVQELHPGVHPIADLNFHGTEIAGIIASNAQKVAGVTSKAELIGIKACNSEGRCPLSAMLRGIRYAADQGVDVINISLGSGFEKNVNTGLVGKINKALNYANSKGCVVTVSAGNGSSDLKNNGNFYKYFCESPNTICVSATGPTSADDENVGPWQDVDAPGSYTNYGSNKINVAAPGGGNAGGGIWAPCTRFSVIDHFAHCSIGDQIARGGGTSQAAAHVSGLAALIKSLNGGKTPGQVRASIQSGSTDLGKNGIDDFYGSGRIDVPGALL